MNDDLVLSNINLEGFHALRNSGDVEEPDEALGGLKGGLKGAGGGSGLKGLPLLCLPPLRRR